MLIHRIRAFVETKKKAAFLQYLGYYRTMTGGWSDSHCMTVVPEKTFRCSTLAELKNFIYG